MNRTWVTVAVLAAGTWFSLSQPVRAQIAPLVDDHGKLVYINGDSLSHRSRSTISSPPDGWQKPSNAMTAPSAASFGSSFDAMEDPMDRIVQAAAQRHNVDPALVKAVIRTESGWNPRAVSRKGAVGLMQLIPETAQRYGVGNPFDPVQNVEGGTMYLKSLLDRYNGDLTKSLAAYNAGEHAVDQSRGVPQIPETIRYVQKVTDAYFQPGSGRDLGLWSPPNAPVRKEVDPGGRVVYTNE